MPFAPRAIDDLPTEFAIFPLTGALLLPRGRLPLNIFEPRYLAMVEDALANRRMFGMIQPDRMRPAGPTGPAVYRIGCLGRLSSFSETDDGRLLITLTGMIRFSVAEELPMCRGYRRVRGDFTDFGADILPLPPAPAFNRTAIMDALRAYFSRRRIDANWDAISALDDDALVTTLAIACPFEPLEKQALLESTDRAATLLALLRIDTHDEIPDDPVAAPRRTSQ